MGNQDALGLQLPETTTSIAGGEGFWEWQSNNIWATQSLGTTALDFKSVLVQMPLALQYTQFMRTIHFHSMEYSI